MIQINTISQYIEAVEKNCLYEYISRGESKKHEFILASAFRPYKDANNKNAYYDKGHIKEFHNYIGSQITDLQNKHFLAFSQHYGLPTNLIDFSYSPLISLFFACFADNNISDEGYVYFLRKNRTININSIIELNYDINLFNELLQYDVTYQKLKRLVDDCEVMKGDYYYNTLARIFDSYFTYNDNSNIKSSIQNIMSGSQKNRGIISKSLYKILISEYNDVFTGYEKEKLSKFDVGFGGFDDSFGVLLIALKLRFRLCNENLMKFDLPFYLSYTPPEIMSRITNQKSLFIYQLFYEEEKINDSNSLSKFLNIQRISPDFTIKINETQKILRELDSLGINIKSIFNDFDNVAKYIKNKFYWGI